MSYKFGVLGFGKMGGAFAAGVESLYGKENIAVYDSFDAARERAYKCGYNFINGAKELFEQSEITLVSVKPQDLSAAVEGVSAEGKTILSIAAGVAIEKLEELFKGAFIARAMPNTCAQIKKCCSTVAFSKNFTEEGKKKIFAILDTLGGCEEVEKESEINDLLAVSGSFTAYAYLYLKEFAKASAERGVDFDKALRLAAKTAIGASEMVLKGEKPVDELIKDVCSKGGTTLAGLDKLDIEEFKAAIKGCVNACDDRAIELGK